jgi:hypothetical protein
MAVCKWTDGDCLLCLPTPCGACDSEAMSESLASAISAAHAAAADGGAIAAVLFGSEPAEPDTEKE